jgi:zinc protease
VPRNHPDFEALQVMNYVLGGGGFSSRLMNNIRIESGLAYSVGSYFTQAKAAGSFQIIMQTKNASVNDALARARAEIARIRDEPVSDAELDEARRYLTGSYALRMDSLGEIASLLGEYAVYDLGLDYADTYLRRVAAVTRGDVQRVARQYLQPEQLVEVVVADLEQVGGPPAAP